MVEKERYAYDVFVVNAKVDDAWVMGHLMDALGLKRERMMTVHHDFTPGAAIPREFDRAVTSSRFTVLVFTPALLADVWAQFADALVTYVSVDDQRDRVIPIILKPTKLPLTTAFRVQLDCTDEAEWDGELARLRKLLNQPEPASLPKPKCPYPGMQPFTENDSNRFFGREKDARDLLDRLRLDPFIAVIGPSGSGKSSLVFAGLLPKLRAIGLFGPGEWLVCDFRPGIDPMGGLRGVIGDDLDDPAAGVRARLADEQAQGRDVRRLLVVVDQFEEVFTQGGAEARPFQEAIGRLAKVPECFVVLTVRADFFSELIVSPLWPTIERRQFVVLPLGADGLREAIRRPAADVGVFIKDALVERLVEDAAGEPGALPFVQETLVLLWEQLERRFLSLAAYVAMVPKAEAARGITGIQVAMGRRADAVMGQLTPEQRDVAKRIFLRLVQFGQGRSDARQQQPESALLSSGTDLARVRETLSTLVANRLLTPTGSKEDPNRKIDISHEALLEGWPELRDWVRDRRQAEIERRRLEDAAQRWTDLGRGGGGILDAVELQEAERWLASAAAVEVGEPAGLRALVEASRLAIERAEAERDAVRRRELEQAQALAWEQRRRADIEARRRRESVEAANKLRHRARILAVAMVTAVGAAWVAVSQSARANNEIVHANRATRQSHVATVKGLGGQILDMMTDERLDTALLLASHNSVLADRWQLQDAWEVRSGLLGVQHSNPRLITLLWGHTDYVGSVAFSPDGKTLATGSRDRTVILWDVSSRQRIGSPLEGHADAVSSVAFSPDGKILASGGRDGRIVLWDVGSRQRLSVPLEGHTDDISSVAFSPNGKMLASGSWDRTIILWEVGSHERLGQPLRGHTESISSVAFNADGKTLASGSWDDTIILWDVASRQRLGNPLDGHTDDVWSVAFSPDGKTLASGSFDDTIILWDVVSRKRLGNSLQGHTADVWSVAFSPDGETLASESVDNLIILWDVGSRERLGRPLEGRTAYAGGVAFSQDGKTLASQSVDYSISLWDVGIRHPRLGLNLQCHTASVWSLAFSLDSKTMASGSDDGTLCLWDAATGKRLSEPIKDYSESVRSIAFSPDGETLASGSDDGTLILWDAANRKRLGEPIKGHNASVRSMAFSKDGKTLTSGGDDGSIVLWDATSGTQLAEPVVGHTAVVKSTALSPDGRVMALVSENETITMWDVVTGNRLGKSLNPITSSVSGIALSHDGKMLAAANDDGALDLWDVVTGKRLGTMRNGHSESVSSVVFSNSGKMLVSGSMEGVIDLWDVGSRQHLGQLLGGHNGSVSSAAFSLDDMKLATGSRDGTIVLWDVAPTSWRRRACYIANRNLTMTEWSQYVGDLPYECTCPDLPAGEGAPSDAPRCNDTTTLNPTTSSGPQ